jgi:hypothetical protein
MRVAQQLIGAKVLRRPVQVGAGQINTEAMAGAVYRALAV